MMATNVVTGLEIEFENDGSSESDSFHTPHSALRTRNLGPVTCDEWITLPIRDGDNLVRTKAILNAPSPPHAEPIKHRQWGEGLEYEAVIADGESMPAAAGRRWCARQRRSNQR
jgi:hypothetical protein